MELDPLDSQYVRFARLVCVNTEDNAFPVRRIGSGFVVCFQGEFFLLTARHVFENQQADPTQTVIPLMDDDKTWWPTNACILLEATQPHADDNTYADLAVFSLSCDRQYIARISEHDYLSVVAPKPAAIGAPIYAFGYPDLEAGIDLDNRNLTATLHMMEGIYDGRASEQGMHIFKSDYLSQIDPNGMSGGPVTALDYTRIGRHLLLIQHGGNI